MATAVTTRESRAPSANGRTTTRSTSLAQGLGWFSIGLGLAQVAAPRQLARFIGVHDDERNTSLMRAIGMRELASGFGILSQRNEGAWLWGRVLGDTMDLALLGAALSDESNDRQRTLAAASAVLGVALIDAAVARHRSRDHHREESEALGDDSPRVSWQANGTRHVRKSITINKPREDVSRVLEEATRRAGMSHLADAEVRLVAGTRPKETEVHVELAYEGGNRIVALARKARHAGPAEHLDRELRHLKQLAELGDIVHSDSSIHRGMHPARPSTEVQP